MKPIEGIDLRDLALEAENAILQENKRRIGGMIRGIQTDLINWREQKDKAEKDLAKLTQKIEAAENKLQAINAGDWSVLNDNMTKNQPTPERTDKA